MEKKSKVAVRKSESKAALATSKRNVVKAAPIIPGEIILGEGDIIALYGRPTVEVTVSNTGDRPIQVGSHCHFFEANRALRFDREKSYGFRLQVCRPGQRCDLSLVRPSG